MSPTLWELPDRLHEFFWLSFSRILLFSFTFPLSQGNMPISWCPEISFYVARHFVLISFNEFSSAPTHLLNHGFVHSKEDTEGCWCFWLLFMPSVLIFFKFCFLFFFFFYEYTCFLGCFRWSPSGRMARFLLTSGIRPLLEGLLFRQQRVFKQSSRNPTGWRSPMSPLAPPASLHIHRAVDTIALKPGGASGLREESTGFRTARKTVGVATVP